MNDSFKHKGLRKKLIQTIKSKGINNTNVLSAIGKVPRHLFMDSGFIDHAYQDKAFPIGADQTISQPFTVAFQTELLEINKGDKGNERKDRDIGNKEDEKMKEKSS